MVKGTRNQITIMDRRGLLKLAGGFYGVPEVDYDRTIRNRAPSVAEPDTHERLSSIWRDTVPPSIWSMARRGRPSTYPLQIAAITCRRRYRPAMICPSSELVNFSTSSGRERGSPERAPGSHDRILASPFITSQPLRGGAPPAGQMVGSATSLIGLEETCRRTRAALNQ